MIPQSRIHAAALLGMATGDPVAAAAYLTDASDVHGTSGKHNGHTLDLPAVGAETRKRLESWGFAYPAEAPTLANDVGSCRRQRQLTWPCKAPEGWKIEGTEHYLYKSLIDEKGQVRAQIMIHYQDGDSWLSLQPKYNACKWSRNHGEPERPAVFDSNRNVMWVGTGEPGEPSAEDVLKLATKGGDVRADTFFDKPAKFPKSPFTIPVSRNYRIHTDFYHRRRDDDYGSSSHSHADGGSEPVLYVDDKEAIAAAEVRFKGRLSGYLIKMRLTDPEGKEIWRKESAEFTAPRKTMVGMDGFCIYGNDDYYGKQAYRRR